jgi:hypothetical protein
MNESFMNELKKYENGRVLLDPLVGSILRVTNYEWVVMSVDNKSVKLQSTSGDYRLGLSPSFIRSFRRQLLLGGQSRSPSSRGNLAGRVEEQKQDIVRPDKKKPR